MDTNYYHRTNICECCGRYEERHIGKNSAGWQFSFQAINDNMFGDEDQLILSSRQDWHKHIINGGGKIFDEYGQEVSLIEFTKLVNGSWGGMVHARLYPQDGWVDAEGWSFTVSEFS